MKNLMNDGWTFVKLPVGSTLRDAEKAEYTPVDLPHDWLIWQADNLYESADAWYRREFDYTEDKDYPVSILVFDGVYMDCEVLLNGEIIATHPYGYTAFQVPLTGKLKAGSNCLMVHIRHQSPNSRWYSGSGIYRDVVMLRLPESYLVPDGLMLKTEMTETGWQVTVEAETDGPDGAPFLCLLTDNNGRKTAETDGISEGGRIRAALKVSEAQLWSPKAPNLYSLCIQYGKQTEVRKIGLRSVQLDPGKGLILNGDNVKLRGVCLHHDLGALGAAFHKKAARRQLQLMKDMGVNAVRTSHNPPASAFLDLCDEMGIIVIDEAFDMWERSKTTYDYARFFPQWAEKDTAAWVRRDRCHPSVMFWSIGNEIYDMFADMRGTEVTKMLADFVRRNDPFHQGFVTFGCNYMPWEGGQRCADYVEAVGYNYGEKYYEKHHADHPGWVIYGSETASVLSSRGVYHFPMEQSIMSEADRQCSALGNSNTSWGATDLRKMLVDDEKTPYSMGQFIWSGIDYIGEPTPYHTRSCYFGQADTACFPKDPYYLFRSFWSDSPTVHIGVSWDWNPGQMIDVPVMTNGEEAELFLNGRSLGTKRVIRDDAGNCLPVWKVPFQAGELRAVARFGDMLCEDKRFTPEETDHFSLTTDDSFLLADGQDLAFVTVQAMDRHGHPVDNARNRVRISVSGGACLMGTDNGDSTDTDEYKSASRRLFNGKLLVIVGSDGGKENVRIRIESPACRSEELVIPVRDADLIPGTSRLQRIGEAAQGGEIPARKIELEAEGSTVLSKDNPECTFRFRVLPANTDRREIRWQVTNEAGIDTPFVELREEEDRVTVHARGDGKYYLRALWGETEDRTDIISQLEFSAENAGDPALDAFSYISAGLYDLSSGEIGAGNDKGIAFSREEESMVGFSRVDFGDVGSDRISVDIFALNSDAYDLEFFDGHPAKGGRRIAVLTYQKPSIWNVYQQETWQLPERLTGMHTLCFRMRDKVHMKGFVFEKQSSAWLKHEAGSADTLYGDSFRKENGRVLDIGNNVSLIWNAMDFGEKKEVLLELEGMTPLPVNTVSVRIRNNEGKEAVSVFNFERERGKTQRSAVSVPGGLCTVTFVFLPGSQFDFYGFRFLPMDRA